ncbi:MAG: hypothetical protein LBR21_07975 [Propionibacteriaceae bacterium]|nr:hypothetical protein [Propionibacteriaceae bacterium]
MASTELLRLVFYVLVTVAVTLAATGVAEWRADADPKALSSLGWLAFPVAVAVAVAVIQPLVYQDDPGDQVRCQQTGTSPGQSISGGQTGFTLCVYQIDEPFRAQYIADLEPLMSLLPDASKVKVTDDYNDKNGVSMGAMRGNNQWWLNNGLYNLIYSVAAPSDCQKPGHDAGSKQDDFDAVIAAQFAERASKRAKDSALASVYTQAASDLGELGEDPKTSGRLAKLSDTEFTSWYAKTYDKIAGCTLTESDLP